MKIHGLTQNATFKQNVNNKSSNTKEKKTEDNKQPNVGAVYESSINKPESNTSGSSIAINQAELKAKNMLILFDQNFNRQANLSRMLTTRDPFTPINQMTQEEARQLVSSDGYFGVEKMSERLFDLAVSLSGGDYEEMKVMKESIIKGFDNAARQWGGDLPDISNNTFDAIMNKFDKWFAEYGE